MNEYSALDESAFKSVVNAQKADVRETDLVHKLILSRLPTDDQALASAASFHFTQPGKMLRAKMAMRGAAVLGVNQQAAMCWAAAIEVLHNASLIHDDICDNDKQRRGRDAVWVKYGQNVALTLGDWLIALSFDLAAEAAVISRAPRLVSILAKHMAVTTAGEAMEFEWNGSHDWDVYLTIAADKTAPLLTAPIQGVAAMAGDESAEATITRYFRDLGKSYQIANDIRNYTGNDGAKRVAGDLARRAPNAVTLSFREQLNSDERQLFDKWYDSDDTTETNIWLNEVFGSGAIEMASRRMLKMLNGAELRANTLPTALSGVILPVYALIERFCESSIQTSVELDSQQKAFCARRVAGK